MNKKYYCVDQLRIKEGKVTEVIAAFEKIAALVRPCKGCEAYEVYQAGNNPHYFILYEVWTTEEDFNAHLATPGVMDLCKARNEFLAEHFDTSLYFIRVV